MASSEAPTIAEVERLVAGLVRARLPQSWKVTETFEPSEDPRRPDVEIDIQAPDGRLARLAVDVRGAVERRDVAHVGGQVRRMATNAGAIPVVAARYLSASVREALEDDGLSYVDATGNMRIAADSPAVFISYRGEDRDPWRKGRPRGTLKGEPAARVARALLDHRRDWRVRDLISTSGASSGATYRVLEYLQREDLIVKKGDSYHVHDWERLLREWSSDTSFQTVNRTTTFIEPRGVDYFLDRLRKGSSFPVAVTGSVAAKEWTSYAPAKAAYVYVSSTNEAAELWRLRPNTTAPNVILLEPRVVDAVPFVNTVSSEAGYPVAAPPQVAADLLNGPGREPAEGEYLIEWLKANERQWRLD